MSNAVRLHSLRLEASSISAMTTNMISQIAMTVSGFMDTLLRGRAAREAKRLGIIVPLMICRGNENAMPDLRNR